MLAGVALALGADAASAQNRAEALELLRSRSSGRRAPGARLAVARRARERFSSRESRPRQPAVADADAVPRSECEQRDAASGQGNPFQQSLNFRGFAASPLLGTPQGVSVFQDGVRINEAFGDVVNWDLVPASAISSIQLIPGSVSAFGLNTLGRACDLYEKRRAIPGCHGRAVRRIVSPQGRGLRIRRNPRAPRLLRDRPCRRRRRLGGTQPEPRQAVFRQDRLSGRRHRFRRQRNARDNALEGTQTLPLSMLGSPRQAYTYPDRNENRLGFVTAKASRFLSDALLLGGNAYYRRYRTTNFSSNVNDDFGAPTRKRAWRRANEATNDLSTVEQSSWGIGFQLTANGRMAGLAHQLAIGASGDFGRTRFVPAAATRELRAGSRDRGERPVRYCDGRRLAQRLLRPLRHRHRHALRAVGGYAGWPLQPARIVIGDRSGGDAALDGTRTFSRFNPALGVTYNPSTAVTAYAGYNEGCARDPDRAHVRDPSAPCNCRTSFCRPSAAKVVAKTFEGGARGKLGAHASWSIAAYRTDLRDDIQFIASGSGAANAGYFQNVGRSRRQGSRRTARRGSATGRRRPVQPTSMRAYDRRSSRRAEQPSADAVAVRSACIPDVERPVADPRRRRSPRGPGAASARRSENSPRSRRRCRLR